MSGVTKPPAKLLRTNPIDVEAARELVASARWAAKVRVDEVTGCHVWVGACDSDGYGRVHADGAARKAHRIAVVAATGRDIAPGLTIDHLCRNRACVNAAHLEAVTSRTNTLRGKSVAAAHEVKTHCIHGHALTNENLKVSSAALGHRHCRTCDRELAREHYALIRAARTLLGMTHTAYVAKYGWSTATARAIIAATAKPEQAELFEVSA